jgi:MFS family permease
LTYLILLGLGALDAAGYSIIAPVVPAIADETGAGPGVMGALVATFAVGMAIGFFLGGEGVRRRSSSAVLAASLALMAGGSLGFIVWEGLPVYFGSRFAMGLGSGGLWIGVTFATLERFRGEEYRRLTGVLAVYSVGGIAGAGLGAIGGIRGPFAAYLVLVGAAAVGVAVLGTPAKRISFGSDRGALRSRAFALASAGILLVALALGTLEGPLPLHFAALLSQREVAALYVGTAIVVGASAAAAGRLPPRPTLAAATVLIVGGLALAGLTASIPPWILASAIAALGFGLGESAALGILLAATGTERLVLAMVVWSQVWALGYLAGPAAGGAVAETLGFEAIGLVPLTAALLVATAFLFFTPARSVTLPRTHPSPKGEREMGRYG